MTLELAHIGKTYQGQTVLRDCSFSFAGGESYLVMGPNGCGKSTLFRIAALLEDADQGEVKYFFNGDLLPHDLGLKRRITMVFPRVGVFNETVFDNVAYGLKIRGVKRRAREDKVQQILEMVGLGPKGGQRALTLSSGETMRLGLARALVIDPHILFLDEPTTSLDQQNTEIIEACLVSLRTEKKLTLILITHSLAQAERIGGSILRLENGRIVAS